MFGAEAEVSRREPLHARRLWPPLILHVLLYFLLINFHTAFPVRFIFTRYSSTATEAPAAASTGQQRKPVGEIKHYVLAQLCSAGANVL